MVEIDISINQELYTNFDTVQGEATVTNDAELTLDRIEIKLECVARSLIRVQRGKTTLTYTEKHKLVYQKLVVFPPENVLSVASPGVQFTLPPGRHRYQFLFKLPANNEDELIYHRSFVFRQNKHILCALPPSCKRKTISGMSSASAQVEHFVKVVAKKKGIMSFNTRKHKYFTFLPIDKHVGHLNLVFEAEHTFVGKMPLRADEEKKSRDVPLDSTKPSRLSRIFGSSDTHSGPVISPGLAKNVPINFQVRFYEVPGVQVNAPASFRLFVTTPLHPSTFQLSNGETSGLGELYLSELEIQLEALTVVTAQGYRRSGVRNIRLCKFQGLHKIDLARAVPSHEGHLFEVELPRDVYKTTMVMEGVVPDFSVCNIKRSYALRTDAIFKATKDETGSFFGLKARHKILLRHPVLVLSGITPEADIQAPIYVPVSAPDGPFEPAPPYADLQA
ncbi:hypothetical protein BABINDRAFT_6595 [Babjeviella inositovora NRRL Y-12698]|uniref:Arrestin-like N-terminal domain-containing protein n=1 Tax=Babjeviella inositovora NRRL Y-12698 TaxID=984486 RepID=A0A1E3QWU2_9ASCO|nr:uncharacterized protein BABINDRAFT_6595 [Babjeviella inositovora NRRL Y-12698]ODQ81974.1 hypothetical protein BABINDRAFT_6595 [Babjeviella inositovora NRRL Y-12698]